MTKVTEIVPQDLAGVMATLEALPPDVVRPLLVEVLARAVAPRL